jgi:hypothetical protein
MLSQRRGEQARMEEGLEVVVMGHGRLA